MQVYNTLSRKLEEFKPIEKDKVYMYVCGLTPYDHVHLGHARTYIAFDIIKRYLIFKGYRVFHIQNITDVDDKILNRSRETKKGAEDIVREYHGEAVRLFKKLNILPPNHYPRVTEHIPEIIALIKKLMERGYAYETESGVYFEVRKFKEYGKLSNQKLNELIAGARKSVDETKKHPEDFALWKKTKKEPVMFESPWGKGRPGWHIECSAMSLKYAETLDIHGGAQDLIFPHHENEIAQSECATNKPFVKYWLHTGFLTVNGEKMSKSLGNFVPLKEVVEKYGSNAIRLFFALTHYRSPIDYNEKQIEQAKTTAERMLNFLDAVEDSLVERKKAFSKNESLRKEIKNKFKNFYHFMDRDFDLPTALTYFFSIMHSINAHLEEKNLDYELLEEVLYESKNIFFILGLEKVKKEISELENNLIKILIEVRERLRKNKDFENADYIREKLKEVGIILEDGKETKWKLK